MSTQPHRPAASEPDASTVSPLLGTNRLQAAVDHLVGGLNKGADRLTSAAERLAKVTQAISGSRGGVGNPGTLGGGKPLGGAGSQPTIGPRLSSNGGTVHMGMPTRYNPATHGTGWPSRPSVLTPQGRGRQQWTRYGKAAGAVWGAHAAMQMVSGLPELQATNTTAQLMSRESNMGAFPIRSLLARNNISAVSDTDALQAGSTLQRSGYAIGSSGYNSLLGLTKNYNVIDPTATASEAAARMASFASVPTGNFLLTRGVKTRDAKGNMLNPNAIADSIIGQAGYTKNFKWTADAMAKQWGAGGNAQMLVSQLAQTDPEMAKMVQARLHARMQASKGGLSIDQFDKAVSSQDWKTLSKAGISKTDLDSMKTKEAAQRNLTDNTAQGFSAGLQDANKALTTFYTTLDKITHGPLGDLLGNGKGVMGSSGVAASIGEIGAGALGQAIGGKLLGKAGPIASRALGGAASRLGGAGASAARAGGGAIVDGLGALGGTAGVVGGAALAGAGAAVAGLGAAAFNATTSDDERHSRAAQMRKQGQTGWLASLNAWGETFNNSISFGLYDKYHLGNSTYKGGQGGKTVDGNGGGSPSTSKKKTGASARTSGVPPVSGFPITAPFGHYSSGKPHYGVDFGCPVGTPVRANRSGKVIKAGWDTSGFANGGFGNHVRIDSGDGLIEIYGHMSKLAVREGQTVNAGDNIGASGATGNVTGPHLHFQVNRGGTPIDPMPYVGGSGGINPGTPADVAGSVASGDNAQTKSSMVGQRGASAGVPWGINEAELVASGLSNTAGGPGGDPGHGASSSGGDSPSSGSTGTASVPASGATGPLRSILAKAGFAGGGLSMAYAIMMAESRGNSHAHNTNARTGDNSYGLFQINMLGGMGPERRAAYHLANNDALFDPLTNAKVAYAMSNHGTNWSPWSTYKRGDYKKYLGGQTKSYDVGSTNIDVDQTARVHKGEMIIDPVTADELRKALSSNTPTSILGSKGKGGGVHIGKIEISTAHAFTDSAATDLARQVLAIIDNHTNQQSLRQG